MQHLKISEIAEGHSVIDGTLPPSLMKPGDASFNGDIRCRAEIDRIGARIQIRLSFNAAVTLQCARCLEGFDFPIEGEFSLVHPEETESEDEQEDDLSLYFIENQEAIDLGAAVYDEIMTALPMKPLCSPECRGRDVPVAIESAVRQSVDPRWEPLKRLRETGNNSTDSKG